MASYESDRWIIFDWLLLNNTALFLRFKITNKKSVQFDKVETSSVSLYTLMLLLRHSATLSIEGFRVQSLCEAFGGQNF